MNKNETRTENAAKQAANDTEHSQSNLVPGQEDAEKELSETTDRLLRLTAEFDNYKKRTAKEKEQLAIHAEGKLMLQFLPIYEEIALAEKEAAKVKEEAVREGVLMVLSKLRAAFEKEGLQEMKLDGEKFDPYRHEVALREESDAPEGEIVRVIQKGYLFKGAVLRHAIVSVSSGKKASGMKKADDADEKTEPEKE
ncbi:MAG: nucleotide exchange factor GrpE [Candidatus Micrarchaeia archaeon]